MKVHPTQIVISGEHFKSTRLAIAAAKHRGFAGCDATFYARLKQGATTWAEFLAPVQANGSRKATRAAHRAEEKALMAQLCAELDARKAALQERT